MSLAAGRGSATLRASQLRHSRQRINGGPYTESQVEFRIWEKLSSGGLPLRAPLQVQGCDCLSAITCAACDELVPAGEAQIATDAGTSEQLYFHPLCYHLLDSARRKMDAARRTSITLRYSQGVPAY